MSDSVASPANDVARTVRKTWQQLYNAGRLDELVGMYTTNAMFFGSSPELMSGQDGVRKYFAHLPSGVKVKMGEYETEQIAPGVISDAGYADFTVKGKVLSFRLSLVLVADGDRWFIAQHHGSPRGAPAVVSLADTGSKNLGQRVQLICCCMQLSGSWNRSS